MTVRFAFALALVLSVVAAMGCGKPARTIEAQVSEDSWRTIRGTDVQLRLGPLAGGELAIAIRDQIVPPTLNLDNPDEGTEGVDLVPHVARKREVKAVLNNSFGFGGTNASLVMKAI